MISPMRLLTKPCLRGEVGLADRLAGAAASSAPCAVAGSLTRRPRRSAATGSRPRAARSSCVCTLASTSPSPVRTIALPTATRSSDWTSHSSTPLTPARRYRRARRARRSRSAGLTSTVIWRRSLMRRSAPCTTSTTSSGRACSAPARILPASDRRELDRVRFDGLDDLDAQRLDARGGRCERAGRGAGLERALLAAGDASLLVPCGARVLADLRRLCFRLREQARGGVARRRLRGLELLEVVADGRLRQPLRPPPRRLRRR